MSDEIPTESIIQVKLPDSFFRDGKEELVRISDLFLRDKEIYKKFIVKKYRKDGGKYIVIEWTGKNLDKVDELFLLFKGHSHIVYKYEIKNKNKLYFNFNEKWDFTFQRQCKMIFKIGDYLAFCPLTGFVGHLRRNFFKILFTDINDVK